MPTDPLRRFTRPTQEWFRGAFEAPTAAQVGAWDAIRSDDHALVVAPTGSGKTLAAFLSAIDSLVGASEPPEPSRRCRVLYVSPLKALAADVERNLRSPLTGIGHAARRAGTTIPEVTVSMRTGDTPAAERRAFATRPTDILITTPESLFLVLTSAAREGLAGVETVILDEIHAIAGSKRGAHLALSLERLDALLDRPAQRVGLSATVRPVDPVARFLAGVRPPQDGGRRVTVVQPGGGRRPEVEVVVPVPDLRDLPAPPGDDATTGETEPGTAEHRPATRSVWPHVEERIVDLIMSNRSTIVFTNARRGAERLTARINEIAARRAGTPLPDPGAVAPAAVPGQSGSGVGAPPVVARAHHGSMSRAERNQTETDLKAGRLPAVVATSSLELGIDMGAVDLVIQVGAPPSVASGLQRIGRAGHHVGAVSHGVVLPTFRGELVSSAVIAERMRTGDVEAIHLTQNPLDVLAQQVVAAVALEPWTVDDLAQLVRRATPFADLGDATWAGVLDMLAGRYPSEDFGELRPRIVWDRSSDILTARPGAQRLAVTSGGTIPDRGQYGVFLAGSDGPRGGRRVGELDEEMVYESRVGDTFTLGSSTWRIDDITPDRVLVTPAPGQPGRLPFWKGDSPGRPAELGGALGAWVRRSGSDPARRRDELLATGLDAWAADNLLAYLQDQVRATGVLPDDRTIVVERFRDELGDWRVVLHSPWGARVHTPWALALGARLKERLGVDVAAIPADDGIVLRVPDTAETWEAGTLGSDEGLRLGAEDLVIDPAAVRDEVRDALGGSVMFAARFREAAARALLLPRRSPDRRTPLWQQRRRASQLLEVASQYPEFPLVLESVRECLQDDFDVPALTEVLQGLTDGRIRLVELTTSTPSPFASTLLVGYTAQFLYDGDAPLAERRAAALTLDPTVLAELLGPDATYQISDLLDVEALERIEAEVSGRAESRRGRDVEGLADVLRRFGPLPLDEVVDRMQPETHEAVRGWLDDLRAAGRALSVRVAGTDGAERWAVVEDAARLRDGLGVALPPGLPEAHTTPVPDPLGDLIRRHARTHGPFPASDVARRFGLAPAVVAEVLRRLETEHHLVSGALRPPELGGTGQEWCDVQVLRSIKRRSLAALRADVEPVEERALGVFAPRWHRIGGLRGTDGVLDVVEQLAGLPLPASAWERQILPARVVDYRPGMLDELTTSGEVLWAGHAALPGRGDGLVSLHIADAAALTLPAPPPRTDADGLDATVLDLLSSTGGYFLGQLVDLADAGTTDVLDALWNLVWAGHVTNDGFAAVRERLGRRSSRSRARTRSRPTRRFGSMRPGGPREAPPGGRGRWSALPTPETDSTRRTAALTRVLLDRHGVLTRGSAHAEGVTDYFRGVYRALSELEQHGAVRRGYFVEHLGAAQFALPGAVDRLRADRDETDRGAGAVEPLVLAACDPANPYGAALAWPPTRGAGRHRPHRGAGASLVLADGAPGLFVERGGRSLLTFPDAESPDDGSARAGSLARALVEAVRAGRLDSLTVTHVDGDPVLDAAGPTGRSSTTSALLDAGFTLTPRGLRLRSP
ncbi:ATP dependent helicase, Lhr family [Paraoerskovia marina]|uniref:ATP dependent helicase, Lhr family n=1 Tax=Paraoerskovia marina TaxID=545619 RepID=A0A1H1TVL5_9CELL|nr:ATP-dependent helicase [Paraoerskovia marina]SDS64355.1 ATP dependent helicase, Lhr family [Paraoerskovia marina]